MFHGREAHTSTYVVRAQKSTEIGTEVLWLIIIGARLQTNSKLSPCPQIVPERLSSGERVGMLDTTEERHRALHNTLGIAVLFIIRALDQQAYPRKHGQHDDGWQRGSRRNGSLKKSSH